MMAARIIVLLLAVTPVSAGAAGAPADPSRGMAFVAVKGGCFQMGDLGGDGDFASKPAHEVCVDDFSIGRYEVTQEQFTKVMGENPSRTKNCSTCPVDGVSWDMAQTFIQRLNQLSGKIYRLPTEAEWEFACRGRGRVEKYCGGNDLAVLAWTDENAGGKTHPLGRKRANALGLYDMSGNVAEWVGDWYSEVFYWVSPRDNPVGPAASWSVLFDDEPNRVLRGGSIDVSATAVARVPMDPGALGAATGLRLVLASRASPGAPSIPGRPGAELGVESLPEGGGAPGAAWTAWEKASAEEMKRALQTLGKRELVEKVIAMDEAERRPRRPTPKLTDEQVDSFYEMIKQQPPRPETKIAGGMSKGDLAILFSEKEKSESGYSLTVVFMGRKDGKWAPVRSPMTRWHAESRSEVHAQ